MLPVNRQLVMSEAQYSNSKYLDAARLDQLKLTATAADRDLINTAVVFTHGANEQFGRKTFPILWQTQGQGIKREVSSTDLVYYNYVFGKPKKTSTIAKTIHQSGDTVGRGGEEFSLVFKDRFFQKNQIIYAGGLTGIQVQLGRETKEGTFYRFTARLVGARKGQSVPFRFLQQGYEWSGGVVKVSLGRSRGTEQRSYSPYSTQNMLSIVRHSFNVAGNAAQKVILYKLVIDGKSFSFWSEFERYLASLDFDEKRDLDLMISKYNKDAQGQIVNIDVDSGEVVPSGMGLWDQVPSCNDLPHNGVISERKLSSWVDDMLALTGNLDLVQNNNIVIDVMCGLGLLSAFDEGLKRNMSLLTPMPSASMFVRENQGGLEYGNYFTAYKHRSGAIIRFTHHRGFDEGALAESAPSHPQYPNRPITSWCGIVSNFGLVRTSSNVSKSGVAGNIQYVFEKDREEIDRYVMGMAQIPGITTTQAATDVDASAWHKIVTQGVNVLHPMSMAKITFQG